MYRAARPLRFCGIDYSCGDFIPHTRDARNIDRLVATGWLVLDTVYLARLDSCHNRATPAVKTEKKKTVTKRRRSPLAGRRKTKVVAK